MGDQFSNAQRILEETISQYSNVSDIRLWPHHFDLGVLLFLENPESSEEKNTISLGFSPGDDHYNQPYYYVSPWPYPEKEILKNYPLKYGFWHKDDFIAAVFPAEQYADKNNQQEITLKFIRQAVAFAEKILEK